MAKSDFLISGSGGQAIIEVDGSKRCQLSGTKYLLWNGRNNLVNAEVIALIKPYTNQNSGYQRGGMLLRCDENILNYYRLLTYAYTNYRTYYIHRVINGVGTLLGQVTSYKAYNIYTKTRFRVDGYQLSIDEYNSGEWGLIATIEDTDHSLISGYAGICGVNYSGSYHFLFDDLEIGER